MLNLTHGEHTEMEGVDSSITRDKMAQSDF